MLTPSFLADFALLILAIIIGLYFYFTRHFDYWRARNVSYIKPVPFVGNFWNGLTMRHCMGEVFQDIYYRSNAPLLGFFILDKPCLLVRDPKLIKQILITDFKNFEDRSGGANKESDPIGAYLLILLKNPEWRNVRAKLSPIFTSAKIQLMFKLFEKSGKDLTAYLKRRDEIVEVKDLCQRFMVEVISSTIFGVEAKCFMEKDPEILDIAKRIFDWSNWWSSFQMRAFFVAPTLVRLFGLKLFNTKSTMYLKNLFLSIMNQRIATNTSRNDFIDLLLQMGKEDPDFLKGNVLVAQALAFFAGGFESNSSAMAFAIYEIAQNPYIQTKLRNEIQAVSQKYGTLSYEAFKEMKYLDQCIKETLRKYPVLPFLDRTCTFEYKVPETNLVIEKNTAVFISTLAMHNDPQYFPNPQVFDPNRFIKNVDANDNFSYLPFGSGPRFCIAERFGMLSIKTGLVEIFQNFVITPCDQTLKTMTFEKNGLLLCPLKGIKLKFIPINEH